MKRLFFVFLTALVLSTGAVGAVAQNVVPGKTEAPLKGVWSGTIMGIKLIFHFATGPSGKTEGTMDSPQQGIMVVGAVNMFSYRESGLGAAFKDIETLKSWEVRRLQIDSELKPAF
ncbi:MAG TPA: hypothetical protein VGN00_12280 [Puia sp.]|jgi:hypothetical protein